MKKLLLCSFVALCTCAAHSESQSLVIVDNLAVAHEARGWRVMNVSTMPVHFNLIKGDLIIRIDGKKAADTGPMIIASIIGEGSRRYIDLFIERGGFGMEVKLRDLSSLDVDPVGAIPLRRVESGFSAPDAEFKDIDGKPVTLEQFKGKWLLIYFTGTWCEGCMEALPKILSAAEHHDLSLNLLVVALNDRPEAVRRMRQKYAITSPVAMALATSELPISFGIATNQLTGQIPSLALIRRDGEVALVAVGNVSPDHIDETLESLMNQETDKVSK